MVKRVKIFSDADEVELESEINSFLRTHNAQLIDVKHSVTNSEDGTIITAVLIVELPSDKGYE